MVIHRRLRRKRKARGSGIRRGRFVGGQAGLSGSTLSHAIGTAALGAAIAGIVKASRKKKKKKRKRKGGSTRQTGGRAARGSRLRRLANARSIAFPGIGKGVTPLFSQRARQVSPFFRYGTGLARAGEVRGPGRGLRGRGGQLTASQKLILQGVL